MTSQRLVAASFVTLAFVATCGCLGCSSETGPEHELEKAAERVADARAVTVDETEDLAREIDDLRENQEEVRAAEKDVAKARESLASANERLAQARTRLDDRASDVAIFRSVQRALLEADRLHRSAVVADVRDRKVTLRGTVEAEEGRRRAVEIAQQTPGVLGVEDELELVKPADGTNRTQKESGTS